MVNRTVLPHTYENQFILRAYGKETADNMINQEKPPSLGWWKWITNQLPTSHTVGYVVGTQLGVTYGAQWSNSVIDLVVSKFFQEKVEEKGSWWSWQGIKNVFWGGTEKTVAETLKLTLTPQALPYITIATGIAGSIALPALISLVSFAYQKAMFDPRALRQLSKLSLDQLFTIDPETGRLRDAFGRLLSPDDVKDILTGTAEYDLVCKLIDLCHQIDQKDAEDDILEEDTKKLLKTLVKSYTIKREDGKVMFPDGQLRTDEEKAIVRAGIADLARINPRHQKENIQKLIKVLAQHSIAPLETLSFDDKQPQNKLPVKRMPSIFEGEQAWKNAIVRTSDGKYVIVQDVGGKKKGTIIAQADMNSIFDELKSIQKGRREALHILVSQPKQHKNLVGQLNQLSHEEIKDFLGVYVIKRQSDNKFFFANGEVLSEKKAQKFQQALALLPTKREPTLRAAKLKILVEQVAGHLAQDKLWQRYHFIKCQDGTCLNQKGESLTEQAVKQQIEQLERQACLEIQQEGFLVF